MSTSRAWSVAGLVAGFAGVAASYGVAQVLTVREPPVVAVADLVIRLTPGAVAEQAIELLGHWDKPALVLGILLVLAVVFAWAGRLARRSWWAPTVVFAVLAALGAVALLAQRGQTAFDVVPLALGFATWLVCLSLLTEPLTRHEKAVAAEETVDETHRAHPDHTRRTFLIRAGLVGAAAAAAGALGRVASTGRRRVEEARRLVRLPDVTEPKVPRGVSVGVAGVAAWMTPADEFYRIDTAISVPAVEPANWQLRIHGMVDRELLLTYQDLVDRELTEAWVTLSCVSNEVGGDLVGNAWWSGVRIADLLRVVGVHEGADAVLQTSDDGWTCGTPLAALTDDRNALLAVAMNGRPLPIEHGFPVRTVVPGLYGYVSACKWVVDLKVTRFADISAYWTENGWSELGPVKLASRIDVAEGTAIAGVAWAQHTGIGAVEVSVDGSDWAPARLARVPNVDTWVQWAIAVALEPGDHEAMVRAIDSNGVVQTGEEQEPVPDGATGWHTVSFTVGEDDEG
ncbi:molybdopterin-dependent oxidoreductase [Nocardioides pyridinolyticus]